MTPKLSPEEYEFAGQIIKSAITAPSSFPEQRCNKKITQILLMRGAILARNNESFEFRSRYLGAGIYAVWLVSAGSK